MKLDCILFNSVTASFVLNRRYRKHPLKSPRTSHRMRNPGAAWTAARLSLAWGEVFYTIKRWADLAPCLTQLIYIKFTQVTSTGANCLLHLSCTTFRSRPRRTAWTSISALSMITICFSSWIRMKLCSRKKLCWETLGEDFEHYKVGAHF